MHEVGHQGAALLCLVESLRRAVQARRDQAAPADRVVWSFWDRWISEIVADFWSVGHVGVSATLGLMQVVSLPSAFVFRVGMDDPHPAPWLRVQLSAEMGDALYPHPQWRRLVSVWTQLYPPNGVSRGRQFLFERLRATMPEVVHLLLTHRSEALRGRTLSSALPVDARQPGELSGLFGGWERSPKAILSTPPTLALAVIGQAKADGRLGPHDEARLISRLLQHWALERTLRLSEPRNRRPHAGISGPIRPRDARSSPASEREEAGVA